jgi:5-methylcytosine-specific restriction protein A
VISRYCSRCHSVKPLNHLHRIPDNRPSARERGYDSEWEATRSIYLDRLPFCHYKNCRQYAQHVHHLDGQGPNGPRGHDFSNLQGLCAPHHSKITAQEQPGGFNVRG